jgi:hypothetical protein
MPSYPYWIVGVTPSMLLILERIQLKSSDPMQGLNDNILTFSQIQLFAIWIISFLLLTIKHQFKYFSNYERRLNNWLLYGSTFWSLW